MEARTFKELHVIQLNVFLFPIESCREFKAKLMARLHKEQHKPEHLQGLIPIAQIM